MKRERTQHKESLIELMGGKLNVILMAIFAVVVLGGGMIWMEINFRRAEEARYIAVIPMANQNIEWTYAGKGG